MVERRRAIKRIIAEHAVFSAHQDVPGGKTGYVVTRERQFGKDCHSRKLDSPAPVAKWTDAWELHGSW